jgi:hypothetical protein
VILKGHFGELDCIDVNWIGLDGNKVCFIPRDIDETAGFIFRNLLRS